MRRLVLFTAVAALAGCATAPEPGGWRPRGGLAQSGERFAQRACAGCHAIGLEGASPNTLSPPFRTLAARLPGEALEADLTLIASRGHVQMPPIYMTPDEIRALAAYIRAVGAQGAS